MNVKVKICGMQSIESAQNAIDAGADYLGFIFVKDSKRSVDKNSAKKIIDATKGKIAIVGVFKNNTLEEVNTLCDELNFDLVQLHGDEDQEFCQKVTRPVIKSFGLHSDFSVKDTVEKIKRYDVKYFLIDRLQPGVGEALSLENSAEIAKSFQLFFAGGLTPENVAGVVRKVKPFAVDVITGVKTDGKFDFDKMKTFVINAKGVTI